MCSRKYENQNLTNNESKVLISNLIDQIDFLERKSVAKTLSLINVIMNISKIKTKMIVINLKKFITPKKILAKLKTSDN